ncbi:MAG: hypothetical protein HY350_00335, partial [Candidatus Omnitrophica bacterium]|nr:hypothetical protein [Candidatus Omnitrophota bacterium]
GSQGARSLNRLIIDAVSLFNEDEKNQIQILHLSGERDYEAVRDGYLNLGVKNRVFAFSEDMASIYRATDLVLSRAGASTISELCACGLPAILVPYPYSKRHQMANAGVAESAGGAIVFKEKDITPEILKDVILRLLKNRDELKKMSTAMLGMACPDAGRKLGDEVLKLVNKN